MLSIACASGRSWVRSCGCSALDSGISWRAPAVLAMTLLLAWSHFGVAQQTAATANAPQKLTAAGVTADEAAIRKNIAGYTEAFNKRDAVAVAKFWTEDGEWIEPDGQRFSGRKAIEAELKAYFQEGTAPKLEVVDVSIEFLAPGVAIEEGTVKATPAEGAARMASYRAVDVRRDGTWQLNSVREIELVEPPSQYDKLKAIEWMIGTWVDRDEDSEIETRCEWTKNKNFITRSFTVSLAGVPDLEGTQVVGWDPVAKQIRSWLFDSAGGFGEGTWTQRGNKWVVRSSFVLNTGEKASSINIFTPIDEGSFSWQSIGRQRGGELLPNVGPVTVYRAESR
jgi:uncharacterized protein (TIGR02246 family)